MEVKNNLRQVPTKLGFSFREASAATSLSRRTLEYLIQQDKLRAVKIGRRTVILAKSLEQLLQGGSRQMTPQSIKPNGGQVQSDQRVGG